MILSFASVPHWTLCLVYKTSLLSNSLVLNFYSSKVKIIPYATKRDDFFMILCILQALKNLSQKVEPSVYWVFCCVLFFSFLLFDSGIPALSLPSPFIITPSMLSWIFLLLRFSISLTLEYVRYIQAAQWDHLHICVL